MGIQVRHLQLASCFPIPEAGSFLEFQVHILQRSSFGVFSPNRTAAEAIWELSFTFPVILQGGVAGTEKGLNLVW